MTSQQFKPVPQTTPQEETSYSCSIHLRPIENIIGKTTMYIERNSQGELRFGISFSQNGAPSKSLDGMSDADILAILHAPKNSRTSEIISEFRHAGNHIDLLPKQSEGSLVWAIGGANYLMTKGKLYVSGLSTDFGMIFKDLYLQVFNKALDASTSVYFSDPIKIGFNDSPEKIIAQFTPENAKDHPSYCKLLIS